MIQQSTPIDPAQVSDRMQVLGIRDDEEWVVLCKSVLTVGGREEWVVLCKSVLTVGGREEWVVLCKSLTVGD